MERMMLIHVFVAAEKFPNAVGLAAELEVSAKTLKRDIQFMRNHWNLPLEYHPRRRGYFYSACVNKFPGAPAVNEAELFALLVAHKAIGQYHGTPFHHPLQKAFNKLTAHLETKERFSLENLQSVLSFRPFAPEDADLRVFELVTRALREHVVLTFQNRKPAEKNCATRQVHPYHLTCIDNRWYLIGHDADRGDTRTFALGRMKGLVLTSERFSRSQSFDPEKYLRGSFSVMKGDGNYEVVIEFDPWATDHIRGRQWHPSQKITELPGGGSHILFHLSGLEEIERWVLSWGAHAVVIRPKVFAHRVRAIAQDLLKWYPEAQVA
jgi:proteasome accessory factor B